jgi:aminocarboxymuconate-semialdehyde decarboxylase
MLDIFNHFMPDSIFNRLEKLVPGHVALKAFPERPSLLDLSSRLKMMDEFEGLQQVLSLANPPIEILGGPDITPLLAQIANDGLV